MPPRKKRAERERPAPALRMRQLQQDIEDLQALAEAAAAANQFAPAVTARSRLAGLHADLARLKASAAADREKDPLAKVRRQRRIAMDDGSHVAATRLLSQELEMIAARDAETRAQEIAARAAADEDGIVARMERVILSLPDTAAERLEAAFRSRRQPARPTSGE